MIRDNVRLLTPVLAIYHNTLTPTGNNTTQAPLHPEPNRIDHYSDRTLFWCDDCGRFVCDDCIDSYNRDDDSDKQMPCLRCGAELDEDEEEWEEETTMDEQEEQEAS